MDRSPPPFLLPGWQNALNNPHLVCESQNIADKKRTPTLNQNQRSRMATAYNNDTVSNGITQKQNHTDPLVKP